MFRGRDANDEVIRLIMRRLEEGVERGGGVRFATDGILYLSHRTQRSQRREERDGRVDGIQGFTIVTADVSSVEVGDSAWILYSIGRVRGEMRCCLAALLVWRVSHSHRRNTKAISSMSEGPRVKVRE